jgi:hypothetical protein
MPGAAANPLNQVPDQRHIALLADPASKPQAYLDRDGQGHPDDVGLFLDTYLTRLHLSQVVWLLDQRRLDRLTVDARSRPPTGPVHSSKPNATTIACSE